MQVPLQEKAGETEPERRRGRRQRVLKKALIVFNGGKCDMGCQILDVSNTGARLLPADVVSCPSEFALKPQTGEPRECVVVWRRGAQIGVRYREQEPAIPGDQRRHPRRRAMQEALIVFNNGHSNMRCLVVDISDVGAKLIPADIFTCPKQFILKLRDGGTRQCAVVWRKAPAIGIQYL